MNLIVTVEQRFEGTPDGATWTQSAYGTSFWHPYLEVFESVLVAARVHRVPKPPERSKRADGERVSFAELPYYIGPGRYALNRSKVRKAIIAAVSPYDAVILRVPSQIASCIEPTLNGAGRPYALEVLGDPNESLGPGNQRHLLRPFFRHYFSRQLRYQCNRAPAVSYVTKNVLQQRYPSAVGSLSMHYSDVELGHEAFACPTRMIPHGDGPFILVTVGSLEQLFKGVDVLIDAIQLCVQTGLDIRLVVVGDGRYRPWLETRAAKLGGRVEFMGKCPAGEAVQAQLDRGHLFVLPSRSEGLPKALLEAMARGMPCLATAVGGIPELLSPEDLVPPNDSAALARIISETIASPTRLAAMSARNLKKAKEYELSVLSKRRVHFYMQLRTQTEFWIKGSRQSPRTFSCPAEDKS